MRSQGLSKCRLQMRKMSYKFTENRSRMYFCSLTSTETKKAAIVTNSSPKYPKTDPLSFLFMFYSGIGSVDFSFDLFPFICGGRPYSDFHFITPSFYTDSDLQMEYQNNLKVVSVIQRNFHPAAAFQSLQYLIHDLLHCFPVNPDRHTVMVVIADGH